MLTHNDIVLHNVGTVHTLQYSSLASRALVLQALRWTTGRSKWWDIGIMLLMVLVFRTFFFICLKVREALSK